MDKTNLRKMGKQLLLSVQKQEREEIEQSIHTRLFHSSLWKQARTIGVTLSQPHEWSTIPIIEAAWKQRKKVVVPKCVPKTRQMKFYVLTFYQQLETVYFGLQEPIPELSTPVQKDDIDLLIVPGLLFDNRGYRIGYGGGYYDRFLQNFNGETVMLASDQQYCDHLPNGPHDIPVEHVLTESGLHKTGIS